ncbi:MAG TPA: alpha-amylase family glycosyl hydrolase [Methanothrix sp.]|nr:alpha-amylase family glycosyl hydrolase [Methanothrix sp.]
MVSAFADKTLGRDRPDSIEDDVILPRRQQYYPSPVDWRDETLYFLLADRFSDGREKGRKLLDRKDLWKARPEIGGIPWSWKLWAESGSSRWQGGSLKGIASKLDYLLGLGITAIWVSPVFSQRSHEDSYHGYGVQDFLEVDPRLGSRKDLADLVELAHEQGMRIILDIIFNHSGCNWLYPSSTPGGVFEAEYTSGKHGFGFWRDGLGQARQAIEVREDGAWPRELQDEDSYTRAGYGNLGSGSIDDRYAEHKRSDFHSLRDFNLDSTRLLSDLARCYKYWIALTDCDGFRIDTLKHVSFDQARSFCGTIKEFAANIGKENFFLVGEVAGGDYTAVRYLDALDRNLNAALDIGEMRQVLGGVAKGLIHPGEYFKGFHSEVVFGSHRNLGNQHVSVLDDHDHVFGEKIRFSSEAASEAQVAAGVALQLFTLGIPCIYYGTEQALAGPEGEEWKWLPGWRSSDFYLREAMFGPEHPSYAGIKSLEAERDSSLPGFGPFGTAGHHCFDAKHPVYRKIAAMAALRRSCPALRHGRQYLRQMSLPEKGLDEFAFYGAGYKAGDDTLDGQIVAWSRILDDEEVVCLFNSHGSEPRSARVLVDTALSGGKGGEKGREKDGKKNRESRGEKGSLAVVLNTAQEAAKPKRYTGNYRTGSKVEVERAGDLDYVDISILPPSEVLVLAAYPLKEVGGVGK